MTDATSLDETPDPDAPVPDHLTGLWRRLSIEYADGGGDVETTVLWLQTRGVFMDLRVPPRPAGPRPSGFHDLSPEWIAALAAQEGFAGRLRWAGDRLRWPRALDFRPLGAIDQGRVARTGRVLVETGDGYVEHWWQAIGGSPEPLASVGAPGAGPLWARAADWVMFAEDRRPAPPEPGRLDALTAADPLAALLDCEISVGARLDGGRWRVDLSTLPWREGEIRTLPPGLDA